MQVETFKSTKDFLMSMENENTRKTYKKALKCFCKLLKIEDLDSLVENFNKSSKDGDDILKNFFNLMKENNFAPKTIASWSSAVKKFLAFNGIKTNFSPKIKVKTVFEDNIPNDEILKEIMENCELRTKAIMLLLLSGLSVKEILELKIKNFKKNEVPKIVFENGKVILITDDTAKTIEFYIKSRKEFGHEINEDSFLISTTDNRKLSYQTLQYLLNREFK
ncbi:MAG: hypothetical protein J7L39_03675, partial [Candidatus Aenigmarchaeota archaeon]|nr:hypothetical protein [Candidatus Aenigmarchaeota archaeon]